MTTLCVTIFFTIILSVVVALYDVISLQKHKPRIPEEAFLNTDKIIEKHGYAVENHTVITEDGYILSLFRMPPLSQKGIYNGKKIPVLLMHGIYCSSTDWVINGPEHSLAYYLVDNGFDVWLGNARGNFYSRDHLTMCPKNKDFWSFSWDEIAAIDLPSMINYITKNTGHERIHYVGHSQGTTVFMAMASKKPEMNDRIIMAQFLSPVAFIDTRTPVAAEIFTANSNHVQNYFESLGMFELGARTASKIVFSNTICKDVIFSHMCHFLFFQIIGPKSEFFDIEMFNIYTSHITAGSSLRQHIHFLQLVQSKRFRKFDHGKEKNLQIYHQEDPPDYDLSRITTPVALYYSLGDWAISEENVKKVNSNLGNSIGMFKLSADSIGHLDYVLGKNLHGVLYDDVLNMLLKYS